MDDIPIDCHPDWVLQPIKYCNEDLKDNEDMHFWCLGCDGRHVIRSKIPKNVKDKKAAKKAVWTFNDNLFKPTFSPSYLCGGKDKEGRRFMRRRCHSYIKEGQIQFLPDCMHELKGQTVPLPPIKDWRY